MTVKFAGKGNNKPSKDKVTLDSAVTERIQQLVDRYGAEITEEQLESASKKVSADPSLQRFMDTTILDALKDLNVLEK